MVRLEQNYRSTGNILNAANGVIRNNRNRKEKTLWTDNGDGEKIQLRQFDTAFDEAEYIVKILKKKYRKALLTMTVRFSIGRMRSPVCSRKNL